MERSEYIQGKFDLTGFESELVLVPPFNLPPTPELTPQPEPAPENKAKKRSFPKGKSLRTINSTNPGKKWATADHQFTATKLKFDPVENLTKYSLNEPLKIYYNTGEHSGYQTLLENSFIWTHTRANRKKR